MKEALLKQIAVHVRMDVDLGDQSREPGVSSVAPAVCIEARVNVDRHCFGGVGLGRDGFVEGGNDVVDGFAGLLGQGLWRIRVAELAALGIGVGVKGWDIVNDDDGRGRKMGFSDGGSDEFLCCGSEGLASLPSYRNLDEGGKTGAKRLSRDNVQILNSASPDSSRSDLHS